jgi:protein TonB
LTGAAPLPDSRSSRLTTALVASLALHAAVVTFLLLGPADTTVPEPTPVVLLPLTIEGTGGGGGGPIPGPPEPPAGPPEPDPAPAAAPPPAAVAPKLVTPPVKKVAKPKKPAPPKEDPKPDAATAGTPSDAPVAGAGTGAVAGTGSGTGTGGGGGGAGTGDGTGGDGSGGARPAHGSNPKPPYPIAARRLGQQGVVMLEVLVKADGHAGEVRVRKSSGHAMLDESAVQTVRERWRFIPAKRNGQPIDATVTFPIRFQLDQG